MSEQTATRAELVPIDPCEHEFNLQGDPRFEDVYIAVKNTDSLRTAERTIAAFLRAIRSDQLLLRFQR